MTIIYNRTGRAIRESDHVWWYEGAYYVTSRFSVPAIGAQWLGRLGLGMFTAIWLAEG